MKPSRKHWYAWIPAVTYVYRLTCQMTSDSREYTLLAAYTTTATTGATMLMAMMFRL